MTPPACSSPAPSPDGGRGAERLPSRRVTAVLLITTIMGEPPAPWVARSCLLPTPAQSLLPCLSPDQIGLGAARRLGRHLFPIPRLKFHISPEGRAAVPASFRSLLLDLPCPFPTATAAFGWEVGLSLGRLSGSPGSPRFQASALVPAPEGDVMGRWAAARGHVGTKTTRATCPARSSTTMPETVTGGPSGYAPCARGVRR